MVFKINAVERVSQRLQRSLTLCGTKFTLPDGYAVPAHFGKAVLLFLVTLTVTVDFIAPKLMVVFWKVSVRAVVPVPETAVYEDAGAVFAQHDVRMTGQAGMVESVTEAARKEIFAHNDFRPRVLRADGGHYLAALIFCENIHTDCKLTKNN